MTRNGRTAAIMAGIVAFMVGVAAISPELYSAFCSLTGFGGTPLRAEAAPGDAMVPEKRLFKYSILYLFLMFGAVIADRWLA